MGFFLRLLTYLALALKKPFRRNVLPCQIGESQITSRPLDSLLLQEMRGSGGEGGGQDEGGGVGVPQETPQHSRERISQTPPREERAAGLTGSSS